MKNTGNQKEKKKMANKDWDLEAIDFYDDECNCKQYKEEEYKRDLKRYFDSNDRFGKDEQGYFCNNMKTSVCKNCLLNNEGYKYHSCISGAFTSFDTIKKIFIWAQEHPATTNADKLTVVFGKNYGALIASKMSQGWQSWLEEEYKKPDDEEAK